MSEERCIHSWFPLLLPVQEVPWLVWCSSAKWEKQTSSLQLWDWLHFPDQPSLSLKVLWLDVVCLWSKRYFCQGWKATLIFRDSKHLQTLPLLHPAEAFQTAQFCPLLPVPSCTFRVISCLMNSVSSVLQCRVFYATLTCLNSSPSFL